jgi:hypothetical protein
MASSTSFFADLQRGTSPDQGCLVGQFHGAAVASDHVILVDADDVRWNASTTAAEATAVCQSPWQASPFCNTSSAVFQSMRATYCEAFRDHPPYSCTRTVNRPLLEAASLSFSVAEPVYVLLMFIVCRILWARFSHHLGGADKSPSELGIWSFP